jgi:hypothetical protein
MAADVKIRRVKEVSKSLKETYREYFLRGTDKFISKYGFKKEDLDKVYELPEGAFTLTGQISEKLLLMEKDGSNYYVEASHFHKERKKE